MSYDISPAKRAELERKFGQTVDEPPLVISEEAALASRAAWRAAAGADEVEEVWRIERIIQRCVNAAIAASRTGVKVWQQ